MVFFDKLKKKDKTVVLDTKIQNAIDEKRFRADELYLSDKEQYFKMKNEAWELYPEPKENWAEAYSLAKDFFETYLEEKDLDKAKEWLNQMIANNNNLHLMNEDVWFNVGKYYFEKGELEQALSHFKEVVKDAGLRYFEGEDPKYLELYKNSLKIQNKEMTDEMSELIDSLSEQGNEEMENENYDKAIEYFNQAFEIIPEPKYDWGASAWLYASIGDAKFCMEEYEIALDNLQQAYKIYGPENLNPFVLLRIGQCYFHLQDEKNATEFLLRAYMLEGEEIFEGAEDYFDFLKSKVKL